VTRMDDVTTRPNPDTAAGLCEAHRRQLEEGSGLAPEVIAERGYRSVDRAELRRLGFAPSQLRPGLLLPLWAPDGSQPLCVLRPDNPRLDAEGKPLKYEIPKGQPMRLDCPPRCQPKLKDPSLPLWITEGQKKADALASHGLCAVALLGVWNFKGRNSLGGTVLLADWDYIALDGRAVHLVFDSDVLEKPSVRQALDRLAEHLQRKKAHVSIVYLPSPNGQKVGVDDYLLTHSVGDLLALASAPQPQPQAAKPIVELLDEPPPALTRPLQLIGGHAYAAAWLWCKETRTERWNEKTGKVEALDPPVVATARRLFVVRDDGEVFGEGADHDWAELGLDVNIPNPPRDSKLWAAQGVKAYRAGYRPDAKGAFARLVALIDRYMAFDRSLADQKTMCELVAAYALSTWFLDSFNVVGFLWPNGSYGSGKTKLGVLVCEVAYLGEVLLSGSSYACLRDLADLGATLLFDDVEALSDPKRTDPDKRNLLLAGNRKGATVAVKEPRADGTWKVRHVNAYCPRLFTAIRLPDPVLASRSIVIPLVRTADPKKANAEVLDYSQWPCDRRKLLDDLWALALANLAKMPEHEAAVNADAPLMGRNLEPWRGILSVAHWLDAEGEAGLYPRLCDLARAYQTERAELEGADLTRLVVRALIEIAAPLAPSAPLAPLSNPGAPFEIAVSDVTGKVNQLAIDEDLADGSSGEYTSTRKVGRILSALRLKEAPKSSGQKRKRLLTLYQLDSIARGYGFKPVLPDAPTPAPNSTPLVQDTGTPLPHNGANGADGANGAGGATEELPPCCICGSAARWICDGRPACDDCTCFTPDGSCNHPPAQRLKAAWDTDYLR